jgi:hypothetical protein
MAPVPVLPYQEPWPDAKPYGKDPYSALGNCRKTTTLEGLYPQYIPGSQNFSVLTRIPVNNSSKAARRKIVAGSSVLCIPGTVLPGYN